MIPCACEHPVKVVLPSGRVVHVPCGHCSSCLNIKGMQRSQLLQNAIAGFKHRYFVTLTYDNEHLPLAELRSGVFYHPHDCDYNGVIYCKENELNNNWFVLAQLEKFGGLPVLSHRDVTNFKKRLRKNVSSLCKLNNQKYEYLFIYACGEYGPTTFRPHYHLLFGTNSQFIGSILKECVSKAWSLGRATRSRNVLGSFGQIDFQKVTTKGVADYTAKYLNCCTHLPNILSKSPWRPFSQKPVLSRFLFKFEPDVLRQIVVDSITHVNFKSPLDCTVSSVVLPDALKNRLFPKPVGFGRVDDVGLNQLYSFSTRVSKRELNLYYDYLLNGFLSAYDRFIFEVVCSGAADRFTAVNSLKRLWYTSNVVLYNCRCFDIPLSSYVSLVRRFYSKLELQKLSRFYELQNSLVRDYSCTLPDLFSLYFDTDESLSLSGLDYYLKLFNVIVAAPVNNLVRQREYFSLTRKIMLDTTKTKKRNDYIYSIGRRRKKWFPIYSNKITKFLQK